jgi:ribosome maturation factor RimP
LDAASSGTRRGPRLIGCSERLTLNRLDQHPDPFKSLRFLAIITAAVKIRNGLDSPFFFAFYGLAFARTSVNLGEILERTVPPLGYELVDWDQSPRSGLVRVFIDKPQGVDVEDCARVSTHLTHLFAVENILYERLEVSSPGLDRALKKAADFARFAGEEVKLTLRMSVDNAKRMKGVLRGLDGDAVLLETDTGTRAIPLANIDKARLVPKIEWRSTK